MGVPPSKLGFECKPDMPPHINILFRARPALELRPSFPKSIKSKLDGVFSGIGDYFKRFETENDIEKPVVESPSEIRLTEIVRKTENKRVENNEKLQECKL